MTTTQQLRLRDFINGPFREFSNYDNEINIPSIKDGLKDSQRKALYGMYKDDKLKRVAQHASRASEVTHYAHGAVSLEDVITNMGASFPNFPNSNNVKLLDTQGQFGNMLEPSGASSRYIYCKLGDNFNKMFIKDDIEICTLNEVESESTEWSYLIPTLPLILLNGTTGIGTGYSTNLFSYSLKEVKTKIEEYLENGFLVPNQMLPTFSTFGGYIERNGAQVTLTGLLEKTNTTTVTIKELPPMYTEDKYEQVLIKLKDAKKISDYKAYSTENQWKWEVKFKKEELAKLTPEKLVVLLKLSLKGSENITLWDTNGKIKQYDSPEEVLMEWVAWKLEMNEKRRQHLLSKFNIESGVLKMKSEFIDWWNNAEEPSKMSNEQISKELTSIGIDPSNHAMLFAMRISSLTQEKIDEMQQEIKKKQAAIEFYANTNAREMFNLDLASIKSL